MGHWLRLATVSLCIFEVPRLSQDVHNSQHTWITVVLGKRQISQVLLKSEVVRMLSTNREIVFRSRVMRDVTRVPSCGR